MIILSYAEHNSGNIQRSLGQSEYSYYFVQLAFARVLRELGTVVTLNELQLCQGIDGKAQSSYSIAEQADAVYAICQRRSEPCVLLSFTPPHRMPETAICPAIPVFAWEYYDLPDEAWDGVDRNNWVEVLRETGRAITHSRFSAAITCKALCSQFPVESIPAPVWTRFETVRRERRCDMLAGEATIRFAGSVSDSRPLEGHEESVKALSSRVESDLDLEFLFDSGLEQAPAAHVTLDGVVFTTVLNPADGRKNWEDIVRAFGVALRDRADATLVVKTIHTGWASTGRTIFSLLQRLQPMKCRIVLIDAHLDTAEYEKLARRTTFAVNASTGEGQCLPLMEFMSCGVPAIAPFHTAMSDYLDRRNAIEVRTSLEPCPWPHDSRQRFTTMRHRLNVESLMAAFEEAYEIAEDPERYASMSEAAISSTRVHSSDAIVKEKLEAFLEPIKANAIRERAS